MLKLKFSLLFTGLILLATSAGAQTKISGTIQCAKPDQQTAIPSLNDRPGDMVSFVVVTAPSARGQSPWSWLAFKTK